MIRICLMAWNRFEPQRTWIRIRWAALGFKYLLICPHHTVSYIQKPMNWNELECPCIPRVQLVHAFYRDLVINLLLKKRVGVLSQEKWELSAVNADLQQRLQQTVALAHMQVRDRSQIRSPWLGDIVKYKKIGLSYRPASLCSLAGRFGNLSPELTLSPQSVTINLATSYNQTWRHDTCSWMFEVTIEDLQTAV